MNRLILGQSVTADGYLLVDNIKFGVEPAVRGVRCGECGTKFEYNKSYGGGCGNPANCPLRSKQFIPDIPTATMGK